MEHARTIIDYICAVMFVVYSTMWVAIQFIIFLPDKLWTQKK